MGDKFEPLLPKWEKVKKQSEALKKGMKPDIVPAIKQYDKAGADMEKLLEEEKKLQDLLKTFDSKLSADGDKYDKLVKQRDKIQEEDEAKFDEYNTELDGYSKDPDADPAAVIRAMNGLLNAGTDYSTMTKSLNDQINKLDVQILAGAKKARDDYKSKSDSIEAQEKKIEAAGKAAANQIRSIALTYQSTATKSSDTDTVGAVREFLKEL